MTFRMIGQQVLYSRPTGYAEVHTTHATPLKVEGIVDDNVPADLPFVWVSDYAG